MPVVLISGALANKAGNGGNAWSRLSWIHGFQKLGFEVLFVEQLGADASVDAEGRHTSLEDSTNLAYFNRTMEQFGLSSASSLIYGNGQQVHGLPLTRLKSAAREACLLFNLSGHLTLPAIKEPVECRVYYDDDPGFTQFWHAANDPGARLHGHSFYFTIGENIGKADCCIPTGEVKWRHTRPPVALEHWPIVAQPQLDRFTTVASWRGSYGPIQYHGKTFGLKVHEFRKFIDLPQQSGNQFEIALQIHPADKKDLDSLRAHGWLISNPATACNSPDAFRHYVQQSGAEFSVAQGVYVDTNSGWFSDRTVRYLASGKPVLVQDTGFTTNYPVGKGLLTFRDLNEAVEGAHRIAADYGAHCQAAREIAEEYFDAATVVRRLLKEIGVGLP
jgi:hypothetical protein